MSPIRVFIIFPSFAVETHAGGIGQYVVELSRALDRARVEPLLCGMWFYHTEMETQRMAALQAAGLQVFTATAWEPSASGWNVYTAFQGMRKILAGQTVDIIHSHTEFGDFAACLLKRLTRVPYVMRTLHNHEWQRRPLLRVIAKLVYPLAFDVEVGISAHVAQGLNARWLARLRQRRAEQINNAINLKRFEAVVVDVAAYKASIGLPPDALVIGSVGRLSQQKGYAFFLRAAQIVAAEDSRAHFVLLGAGELEEELRALTQALGLQQRVVFAGPRPDVAEWLRVFNLFVSSSLWEGLPTVILEAMSAGTPVLATDIPGTRALIQDGLTGHLVPPGDVQQLGRAMLHALKNPDWGQTLVEKARQHASQFTIQTVARQYEELYQRVITKRRACV